MQPPEKPNAAQSVELQAPSYPPPPVYHFKGNMEYAAPGTTRWAHRAYKEILTLRAENDRLRERLRPIKPMEGDAV